MRIPSLFRHRQDPTYAQISDALAESSVETNAARSADTWNVATISARAIDSSTNLTRSFIAILPSVKNVNHVVRSFIQSEHMVLTAAVSSFVIGGAVGSTWLTHLVWSITDFHPQRNYCNQFSNFSWVEPGAETFTWINVPQDLTSQCNLLYGTGKTISNPVLHRPNWDRISLDEAGPFPLSQKEAMADQTEWQRYQVVSPVSDGRQTFRSLKFFGVSKSVGEALFHNFLITAASAGMDIFAFNMLSDIYKSLLEAPLSDYGLDASIA